MALGAVLMTPERGSISKALDSCSRMKKFTWALMPESLSVAVTVKTGVSGEVLVGVGGKKDGRVANKGLDQKDGFSLACWTVNQ